MIGLLRAGAVILTGWFIARVVQRKRAKDEAARFGRWRRLVPSR